MQYVERFLDRKQRPPNAPRVSEDDIPLALSKATATNSQKAAPPPKKVPKIDWFDFFLSAGCDLDDCTRYAASFERDKIDETLLADITEGTMRSLGLREGDIIRVKKGIERRKPTDNLSKPSSQIQEQLRRDEELARHLQAQENTPSTRAPNLFAGPGGVLKPRRGRPQPSKSTPPSNVDIKAISSASDQIQRTGSPQVQSSADVQTPSLLARHDPTAPVSGFEDDAWTNRPSSTKPVKSVSPAATPRTPSAPPLAPQLQPQPPVPTPTVARSPPQPSPTPIPSQRPSLAKTTESDIFEQLAKLSELRKNTTPAQPQQNSPSPALNVGPPIGIQAGYGMSSSPLPMGHLVNQPTLSPPPQSYNGPRGPFAPVPANQSLLQPLIPTRTGFNGFIPTNPANSPSPFQNQLSPTSFLPPQTTGFPNSQPLLSQPTGVFNFNAVPPFQGSNGFSSVQNRESSIGATNISIDY